MEAVDNFSYVSAFQKTKIMEYIWLDVSYCVFVLLF